jgi:hypothetical protein
MAELPPYPGTPRWAKVFGVIFGVVVLLFFTLLFTRGPHHGPSRHIPSGVRERGAQQP